MRVILRDGRVAEFRVPQATEADRERLKALFARASSDSLYFRFFHVVSTVDERELERMMQVEPGESYALVCDAGDAFLAVGNYARLDEQTAEVAFFVDDRLQGRGVGTLLLEHLAEEGWRQGFRQFVAYVLNDNYRMLRVFRSSGFTVTQHWKDGVMELTLPLAQTERQRSLTALREKLAAASSLHPFFQPQTVALVGASRDGDRLGHQMLQHLIQGQFRGTVYPVNREAASVLSIRAYPRLADIPERIDLAVLMVPAQELLPVINDAIYAGVRGVVIVTSGLGDGALEQTIVAKLRQAGIRLVGPNSMGIVTTSPAVSLNASLAPAMPRPGRLAVASHSGALGVAIMNYADRMNLGISSFVSLGNKPDVSVNDLLQYWEDDADTDVIMLYMESFGNPRKFSQITRRLTRHKPVLAVKSARTRPGRSGAAGVPTDWDMVDAPVDALFRQSGIIRADTLEELFDVAALLTSQPVPQGGRVALVTNSAAGTVLAEDAVHQLGLELDTVLDVGFHDLAAAYREAITALLSGGQLDALVILFVPVNPTETEEVLAAIRASLCDYYAANPHPAVTVLANVLLADLVTDRFLDVGARRIPVYPFPETALHALARVRDYGRYVEQPVGRIVDLANADTDAARAIIRRARAEGQRRLSPDRAHDVMVAMGLAVDVNATMASSVSLAMVSDPLFGPLLAVQESNGGVHLRLVPLTDQDAARLVPTAGQHAVWLDGLLRLSRLVEDCPEIIHLELSGCRAETHRLSVASMAIDIG